VKEIKMPLLTDILHGHTIFPFFETLIPEPQSKFLVQLSSPDTLVV
jgi:hypothetical protein